MKDLEIKTINAILKKYPRLRLNSPKTGESTPDTFLIEVIKIQTRLPTPPKLKIEVKMHKDFIHILATSDGWIEAVDAPSNETVYLYNLLRVIGGWLAFVKTKEAERETA